MIERRVKVRSHNVTKNLMMLVAAVVLTLASCSPEVPKGYIQPDEMENILYDYHVAEGIATQKMGDGDQTMAYQRAVLKKYGVTQAEFDSSMVYYMQNTKLLHGIYEKLSKRLQDESKSLGSDVAGNLASGQTSLSGDTAQVWTASSFLVLPSQVPFNYHSFSLRVDSSYHAGDMLTLQFDSRFIFQDGMRDGVAVIAMTLKNDSVITRNARFMGNSMNVLQISDDSRIGIKAIEGYFLLNTPMSDKNSTTMKLVFLENIRLLRVHRHDAPAPNPVPTGDSLRKAGPDTAGGPRLQARPQMLVR